MGLIITAMIIFYGGGVNTYGSTDYNSSDLEVFNSSISELQDVINETANDLQNLKGNPDATDILSAFFTSAYGSAKTAAASISTFFKITNAGVGNLGLGSFGNILVGVLGSLIVIILFVGIILHLVTKSDRT